MIHAVSCGGVAIYRGKALLLYRDQNGAHTGWVMPKGTVEDGETHSQTAAREVREETGASAKVVKYVGRTNYRFREKEDGLLINKTVYWYLMAADSFYCHPQTEEHFADAGFYKRHEAYHLLKYYDEKQILAKAFDEYDGLLRRGEWAN